VVAGWHDGGRLSPSRQVAEFDSENHPALQAIENTWEIVWLGIWDDFRNFLVTAA